MLPQDFTSGHVRETRAEQTSAEQGLSKWQENVGKGTGSPTCPLKGRFSVFTSLTGLSLQDAGKA